MFYLEVSHCIIIYSRRKVKYDYDTYLWTCWWSVDYHGLPSDLRSHFVGLKREPSPICNTKRRVQQKWLSVITRSAPVNWIVVRKSRGGLVISIGSIQIITIQRHRLNSFTLCTNTSHSNTNLIDMWYYIKVSSHLIDTRSSMLIFQGMYQQETVPIVPNECH